MVLRGPSRHGTGTGEVGGEGRGPGPLGPVNSVDPPPPVPTPVPPSAPTGSGLRVQDGKIPVLHWSSSWIRSRPPPRLSSRAKRRPCVDNTWVFGQRDVCRTRPVGGWRGTPVRACRAGSGVGRGRRRIGGEVSAVSPREVTGGRGHGFTLNRRSSVSTSGECVWSGCRYTAGGSCVCVLSLTSVVVVSSKHTSGPPPGTWRGPAHLALGDDSRGSVSDHRRDRRQNPIHSQWDPEESPGRTHRRP